MAKQRRKKVKIRFTDEYFTNGYSTYSKNRADHSTIYHGYPPSGLDRANWLVQADVNKQSITWYVEPEHVRVVNKPTVLISI